MIGCLGVESGVLVPVRWARRELFLRRGKDGLDGDESRRLSGELSMRVEALEKVCLASSSLLNPLLLLVFNGSKLTE